MKNDLLITTTSSVDNAQIEKYLGVISTNIVLGVNVISDIFGAFSDFFGGFSGKYKNKLSIIYKKAQEELEQKARSKGANCILNFRVDFDEISGQGKSMFMIAASGTAVVLKYNEIKPKLENGVIPKEDLIVEAYRKLIVNKIITDNKLPTSDEWKIIIEQSISDVAEHLFCIYKDVVHTYQEDNGLKDLKSNMEEYINSLDYNDSVKLLYPHLMEDKNLLIHLIISSNSFSAKDIDSVFNDLSLHELSLILSSNKPSYNKEDLIYMKSILEKIDSLPDIQVEKTKKNLLGKEKPIKECSCGKSFDLDIEYCPNCSKNMKGFKEKEQASIDLFRAKTISLEKLLNN